MQCVCVCMCVYVCVCVCVYKTKCHDANQKGEEFFFGEKQMAEDFLCVCMCMYEDIPLCVYVYVY